MLAGPSGHGWVGSETKDTKRFVYADRSENGSASATVNNEKEKKNTRKGASERQTFRSKRMMIRNKILWAMKVVITELLTVSMDWLWSLWGLSLHTDDTDGQRDRVWLLSVCFGAVGFVEVHPTVLVLFTKVQILSNPEQFWLPCSLCLKDSEKPDRNSTDC